MHKSFANSPEQIQRLIQTDPASAKALENAKERFALWKDNWKDSTAWLAGWGHNFSCPKCSAHFHFTLEKPETFTCPHCGTVASGTDLDEAWVYYYRIESAGDLTSAALLALLGDEKAKAYIIRYVDFYAEHYAEFPVHGRWAGKGKITGQMLDEAVWALAVLRALMAGRIEVPAEKKAFWYENLFLPMTELLQSQLAERLYCHNILLWMRCAIGVIAIYFEDKALLRYALDETYGIRWQVANGYTADGFWYEGSTHYHYYSTEGLTEFIACYSCAKADDPLFDVLEKCYTAPMLLSADGWEIPSTNDGWFPRDLSTYFRQIQRAARAVDSSAIVHQVKQVQQRCPECFSTPDSLLFRVETAETSIHEAPEKAILPEIHFAMLHQPIHAVLRSGVISTSHMHEDYASISLDLFSRDLGTPGYGNHLTDSYYRKTFSHNSFVVNETSQPNDVIPSRIEATENGFKAIIDCMSEDPASPYYQVSCIRTLTVEGDSILDRMELNAPKEVTFDWLLHLDGEASLPDAEETAAFTCEHFTDMKKQSGTDFVASFRMENRELTVGIPHMPDISVFTGKAPGNPADCLLTQIIQRKTGTNAVFYARYCMKKDC